MAVSFITDDLNTQLGININTNNNNIDDIDFGIEFEQVEDLAVNQENIIFDANLEKINPFYVGLGGGNLKKISWGDMYRNYNSVVVITFAKTRDLNANNVILKQIIAKEELKEQKNLTYIRTGLNILKNKKHYNNTMIVNNSDLYDIFQGKLFNQTELVLCMFELNEMNLQKYCDFYQSYVELSDISDQVNMFKYYLGDYRNLSNINLDNVLSNLKNYDYWSTPSNLEVNITNSFVNREFNNQRTESSNFVVINDRNQAKKEQFNQTNAKKEETVIKLGNNMGEYPVNKEKKKEIFVDPSIIIRTSNRNFTSYSEEEYTNSYINKLFDNITNDKLKYKLINNLLTNKQYCHLVINNYQLLEKIKPFFDKYPHVFKYTMGYAWLTYYMEECIYRTRSNKSSRYVYDISTASKLPTFPFIMSDLKQNPYLSVLIDDKELYLDNSYGLYYKDNYDGYGVTDIETFKKRMNIFMSDDPECDPLDGLNWHAFAISGSAITACLQKRSPLLDYYVKLANNQEIEGFKQFVRKYYGESDVDLMSNHVNYIDFLKNVQVIYDLLKTNLKAEESDRRYEVVKSCAVSISEHFYTDYLDDFNKTYDLKLNVEEFEKMSDSIVFKTYIYKKYIEVKNIMTQKLINEKQVDINNKFIAEYLAPNNYDSMNIYKVDSNNYEHYNIQDTEVIYYRNDVKSIETPEFDKKDNKMVIKFSDNLRFQLFCKKTKVETFRIREKEFFSCVARFHFPCVRAYYQGDNVYILPSCITAMMTGLNIEYKYFAGIRNPNEIINKYISRGFGVLLNKFERNIWVEYNKKTNNKINAENFNELLGPKFISNIVYNIDNKDSNIDKINNKIFDKDELSKYYEKYQKNSCVDCTKMTTINANGNINKYQQSYVELCYNI